MPSTMSPRRPLMRFPSFFFSPFVSRFINLASGDYYGLRAIWPLKKKKKDLNVIGQHVWTEIQLRTLSPDQFLRFVHVRRCQPGRKQQRERKQPHGCETYRFLLLILNTSFCSSCTKRKNSLIWALIDIGSILIRSTLAGYYYIFFLQFLSWCD